MNLARSTEIDDVEYEEFLDSFVAQPGTALAYHYPFYLRFLREVAYPGSVARFITARDDSGRLVGVLPAIHVRTAGVNVWLSLAYFGPNAGALVRADDTSEEAAVVRALVAQGHADADERGCGSMTVYTPLGADPMPYRGALGAEFEIERRSQCLEIPASDDLTPWPRKVRYDVRRAVALGVTTRPIGTEAELDIVWDIYRENCAEHGIPLKPQAHIRRLFATAGRHGVFLLAEQEGEVIAGLICFGGGGVLSYYLPCTKANARPLQVGLLLLDRAVEMARAAGCRLLNFEGSLKDSVYRFKARCGGQPVSYRVFVKLLRPSVMDDYRALTPAGVAAEAPHAFVVPFEALQ